MPANFLPTGVEYFRILPEIILTLAGVLIMFLEAVFTERRPDATIFGPLSIAGAAGCSGGVASRAPATPAPAFSDMLVIDGFATFFRRW